MLRRLCPSVCAPLCALLLAAALLPGLAGPAGAASATAAAAGDVAVGDGVYVVTLRAAPAAAYAGGRDGYPATRASVGSRFDSGRPAVRRYRALLTAVQNRVLAAVDRPRVLYRYTTALNGFAARLTGGQVRRLRAMPQVASVERNAVQRLATVDATDFLGLSGAQGVWSRRLGGAHEAGAGVVVGVVDTGIWPENPSFADLPASVARPGVPGFTGTCGTGQQWSRAVCGTKVVAARHFVRGFGADALADSEYLSPRDGRGHGSHTAATAAGNHEVQALLDGESVGTVSGVAPAARLAVYKACWTAPDPRDDGCATADTVKAVDQAVADGVDVLNYSIAGQDALGGAVEESLRHAAAANVVVVAPAGNAGPAAASVGHPSPWVVTVGASTYETPQGAVVLGNGRWLVGAMAADDTVDPAPLVRGEDLARPGSAREAARTCVPGSLDARRADGAVVVCERGDVARVDKSAAVARAGGVAMVLANTRRGREHADLHTLPTVHLEQADARVLEGYLDRAGPDATAWLDPSAYDGTSAPRLAPFSARGPSEAGGGPLKPDVTAPGVGVVAAVAPRSNAGRRWDSYSGTSVAAAHVAGLAALVRSRHPAWSPAAAKSALMTTAYDLEGAHRPLGQGAGHVDPDSMLEPGLVYGGGSADRANVPSIAVGRLVGAATVTRTVTNVGGRSETYTASLSGLSGVDAVVRPRSFTLDPGESRTFRVRFAATAGGEYGEHAQGWLRWEGSAGHVVRSPVAVRPETVRAPARLRGQGASGSAPLRLRSGMAGNLDITVHGPVASTPKRLTLTPGPLDFDSPTAGPSTATASYDVPAGAVAARFEVSRADGGDLDLYVYRDDELVAASTGPEPTPRVTLQSPPPGGYQVLVHASGVDPSRSATGTLNGWVVPGQGAADRLTVEPNPVPAAVGEQVAATVSWTGLDPARHWLGVLHYDSSDEATFVSVY